MQHNIVCLFHQGFVHFGHLACPGGCLISFNFGTQFCLEFASLCNDWPATLTGTTKWTKPARTRAHA